MLVRSAARKQQRHTSRILAASFAQLTLPWLAPAQLRWTATQTPSSTGKSAPTRRLHTRRPSLRRTQLRCLATAADSHISKPNTPFDSALGSVPYDEHVPFDFSTFGEATTRGLSSGTDPIILHTTNRPQDTLLKLARGVTALTKDLMGHLHTSLSVGRRDRAAAIVQRLVKACGPHSEEAVYAHSVYLHNLLLALMLRGRDSPETSVMLGEMQRWFEVEVRNKGTQPDASMLVTMMRASIRALGGSRRDRSIRRYADISQQLGDDVLNDVFFADDWDDNEYAILGRATEGFYKEEVAPQETNQAAQEVQQMQVKDGTADMLAVPEVRQTEQKGLGLVSIKKTMDLFTQMPNLPASATAEEQRELAYKRQRKLEDAAVDVAIERWKSADEDLRKKGIHTSMQTKPVSALMWQWYARLLPALEAELVEVKKALAGEIFDADRVAFGPYLELLPIKKVAANTILYVMSRAAAGKNPATDQYESDTKLAALTVNLSKALEDECLADAVSKGKKPAQATSRAQLRQQAVRALQRGIEKSKPNSKLREKKAVQAALTQVEWPLAVQVKLGAMLVSKLIHCAQLPVTREHPRTKEQITQMQPAFLHRVKYQRGKRIGVISPHPALMDKVQHEPIGSLLAKRMPMIVEPLPWTGWNQGAYLHYTSPVLRLAAGDRSAKDYFLAADAKNDLDTVYKGLTALGKVPWKVHQGVFKVQLEAWNSGEAIANFAPLNPDLPMPPEPASSADQQQRKRWVQECREMSNRRTGNHSKRCFQNFQLEIARTMLHETLYFPHNLDFRGRAYPIPPYLNHMGADNVRGLLVFKEGKELGENGLRWLKIHTATVAGHDKASMEERVEFTMKHLDDIYDSVRNPLSGRRWWLQAEDAWQTLAACFELVAALDSPDPVKYVSHLPIQQDGTCNGLQHYAALGGDKAGAAQVNLEPSDRPADVYTAVAEVVKAEVEKDAKDGNPVAQKLHGRITRKCVKQPVMTNVYGVTFYGARMQVRKQLESIFPDVKPHDPVDLGQMAHYVATKIFQSLGQMFTGAQSIQHWLGQCADRVATCLTPEQVAELKDERVPFKQRRKLRKKALPEDEDEDPASATKQTAAAGGNAPSASKPLFKSTVVWTTPLRLPVVQPYRSAKSKVVSTTMQQVAIQEPQVWDPVSRRKQLQAFPPNFIHSLDATHMLLSALKCTDNGMTFASVHDSFWTHACDVNRMSEVLRDAFVAMHSEDIIGRLREEFDARYKGHMYLATVVANSSVGKRITKRRQEIKQEAKDAEVDSIPTELALEAERIRLMQSEDSEERAKGEAMVTPGSILSSESDTAAFAPSTGFEGTTLGELPVDPARVEDAMDSEAAGVDSEPTVDDVMDLDLESINSVESVGQVDLEPSNSVESVESVGQVDEESKPVPKKFQKKKQKPPVKKLLVWQPLTFPEVPEKGDFDVRRLRESRYFFH